MRPRLPYGVVMATAGASTLAGRCGLAVLVVPLLILAAVQALGIGLAGVRRLTRRERRALGSPEEVAGMHTVPLGLAVLAGGFAGAGGSGSVVVPGISAACLSLAWLLAALYTGRFLYTLAKHGVALRQLDGTWFLVPAASLGAALASADIAAFVGGGTAEALDLLALVGALIGWLGYWVVAVLALIRVRRCGLGGVAQAPWWIAMGCAGLAAAALGRVASLPAAWAPWLGVILVAAIGAAAVGAVVLALPVVAMSSVFLTRRCRFREKAVWPPTFSSAVFALGCLETGLVWGSPALRLLGLGAGFATVAFWVITAIWNARCHLGDRARARGAG